MLNHAFLIYAHAYPKQLKEIIDLLSANNHYCFINIDKKAKWAELFIVDNKSDHNIFLEGKDRMEISHGGYSQIEVTLRLLHKAYELGGGITIDYFHLISGQDFPVHSNKVFDSFFEKNIGKSFMQFDSLKFRNSKVETDYANRTQPWWFIDLPHRNYKIINLFARTLNFISKHFYWRKSIPNLWGGWSWFTWHRSIAEYILQQESERTGYFKRFHHTRCGDELIFATLLKPKAEKMELITDKSLRYVNWDKNIPERKTRPSAPLTLNEEEYEDIIKSGAFFCRKIDPTVSNKLKKKLIRNIQKENLMTI